MSAADEDPDARSPESLRPKLQASGRAADAGWTLSGSVIGCLLIGYLLGEYFGWNPGATVTGLIVGLVVGFYNLAKVMGLFRC
jgi:F0F1-type ATP synthase assembly protein I